jgi:uncharacterized protein (TIGR03437 family)
MKAFRVGLFAGILGFLCTLPGFAAANQSICDAVPGNLVANCGFETSDFTDWTITAAAAGSDFDTIEYHPNSGTYGARFGALDGVNDYIDQSLATIPGHSYKISFYLDASRLNTGGTFVANWNGTNILKISGATGSGYSLYTFTLPATSNNTDLQFGGNSLPAFYYLDDVVVTDTLLGQPANLVSWGDNGSGALGNGGNTGSKVAVPVDGLAGVWALAGGFHHSLALKSSGTVWAWGDNQYGELGNGSNTSSNVPVEVSSLSKVVAIAGGGSHSLALLSVGTVWAWGENQFGELGIGSNINSNVPVRVNNLTGVVAIAGGGYQPGAGDTSLALKSDGTVRAWGDNQYGELGNGSTVSSNVPVQVADLSGVVAIAGGFYHSLALKSDGTVWAWGDNQYGELGIGTTVNSTVPVQVTGLPDVVAIAGGLYHSLALGSDGTVWVWGYNTDGELGNGSNANSSVPVQLAGLTGVVAIASGGETSLALKSDGTVWAWGINSFGELGNGSTANSNVPVQVSSLTGAVAIAGGFYHSLAAVGGSVPALELNPSSLSFAADGSQTITVSNEGAGPLRIGAITLLGVNPADFELSGTCSGASLIPSENCTLTVTFGASAVGSRSAALLLTANAPGSPILVPLSGTGVIQPLAPAPTINAVVSASDFGGFSNVSPGSWVEIYGSNLAPDARGWSGADFSGNNAPTSLDGVGVTIGGQKAFVDYISPTQVNAELPSNIATGGPLQLSVTTGNATSAPFTINVLTTRPGLLAPPDFQVGGNQYVVAVLPDGTYVLPAGAIAGVTSRPAKPGETITLYGIGFGSVTPAFPAGQIVTQLNQLTSPFQVLFGETAAQSTYSGLAPTLVGLYQFDVVVPSVPNSDLVPLTFNLGKASGTQQLYTAVHQ